VKRPLPCCSASSSRPRPRQSLEEGCRCTPKPFRPNSGWSVVGPNGAGLYASEAAGCGYRLP
jgi:hypothetical protein